MSGRQRSHSFAITFNHVEWSKTCFGQWCVDAGLVKRICVAEEKYHPALDPDSGELMNEPTDRHHHVFVEFIDKYFLPEVRDLCIQFLCEEEDRSVNVQVTTSF